MKNRLSDPRVREFQKMLEAKLGHVLGTGKVQAGTLRMFTKLDGSNKTLTLKTTDKVSVIPEVEMLLPEDRIAIVYSQAVGFYVVPVTDTGAARVESSSNGKYVSYPHSQVFTATEIASLRALYNAKLAFVTDQDTRFDAVAMSDFAILPQQSTELEYGLQHNILPTYFPMVGGKPNEFKVVMPSTSDITNISGTATSQNYLCVEFGCMYLVGADFTRKAEIMEALYA